MTQPNIHPSCEIGDSVVIDDKAWIGPNCYLDGHITVDAGVVLKGGITLVGDIVVGRDSILEPGVCIASPKPGQPQESTLVRVGHQVHVGAGTVLLSGVSIGHHSWIEPGTVVLRNIPAHAIVSGNPATISGYMDDPIYQGRISSNLVSVPDNPGVYPCQVKGVMLHHFPRIRDLRGDLSVGEFERSVPFLPKRYFIVYDVPSTETRGEHAHMKCHQFLVCVAGSVSVVVDDGMRREEVLLERPNIGLFIPAGIWGVQYKYTANGTLLVFASEYYDGSDYIRNYDDFLKFRGVSE